MTKKEMIKEIQVAEAKAWKLFQEAKKLWGREDSITAKLGSKWNALHELRKELGIESLPVTELVTRNLIAA